MYREDELWQRYHRSAEPRARDTLAQRYLGLVHHVARQLLPRLADSVELDDLVSAGSIGLLQAMSAFDPSRGLAFSTFAVQRIRGAMIDELRSRDWAPRSVRARARQMAGAVRDLEGELGREPTARETAMRLGIDLPTYWRWTQDTDGASLVSLDQAPAGEPGAVSTMELVADRTAAQVEDDLDREEELAMMRENLLAMPERERMVLTLSYYEELTLREIAEVLGVTESRVSQIRTQAVRKLRGRMELAGAA